MLVNFTCGNYRSIRDERTLSMEAASIHELEEAVCHCQGRRYLPVAVLYGANSSGKSNVLRALVMMRQLVLGSVRLNPEDKLDHEPFALALGSEARATTFEIQICQEGVFYRYGFAYTRESIEEEWLYRWVGDEEEEELFDREGQRLTLSEAFPEGMGKEEALAPNRLFLSLVAQLNGRTSGQVMRWFQRCHFISGISSDRYEEFTLSMFDKQLAGHREAMQFLKYMQLGFDDLVVREQTLTEEALDSALPPSLRTALIQELKGRTTLEALTTHQVYDETGEPVETRLFIKDEMESEGTKKVIEMSGPIFNALHKGDILVVDELDAKLHPILTRSIIKLFMTPELNTKGAQLICATHDTHLLNPELLRRDQIWFTEKDRTEATDVYSLVEFRHHPSAQSIEHDYINGRYGAIPFISGFVSPWEDTSSPNADTL